MKYKNRLIIPTLVSTSLLASTMVANAEEVDQNEQYSGQSTEEYAVNDETSEKELDFIESEEASEEETEDEKSEDDSKEKTDEETDELEDLEETETAQDEEVAENELDENNIEEIAETPAETVEEPGENEQSAEAPVDETEADETAEEVTEEAALESYEQEVETEVAEPAEEVVAEESAEISEEVEEPAEQPAESEQSTGTFVEVTDEPVEAEEPEVAAPAEAVDENAVDEIETEEVTTESVEKTAESEQNSAANSVETVEAEEQEAEVEETESPQSEEATYKYNSESMEQELENLSEEEQTAFLEENADNIEVDEEMLNSLAEGLAAENEEINADELAAATASTMSTMTLSEAITDINQYIADNNFEVAEIQYDYIPGLPEYAYHSNYGWEPENGEVGKPKGVVLHDVGNDNSTIHGEISYMSRNWKNAFVHAFVDADNIIQVADTDYLAYGAGPYSNDLHMHVELVRHDNAHDFAKSINNYADYIANLLYKYKLPVVSAEETGEGTLFSHVAVSNHLDGTASPDPYEYFARFDYEYNDVINLIGERYADMFNKRTSPQISMPIEQGTTDLLAEVNTNNSGLYESVTDVRTKNANNLLGQQFRVVRTATYNYDDYYLLENEDGVSLGWMYAGDLTTSEYVPEVESEEDLKEPKPEAPEVPTEPELEESDETADEEQAPEEDNTADKQTQDEENTNTGSEEAPVEESNDSADEGQSDEQPAEPANPETPEEADQPEDNTPENTNETDDSTDESKEESADNENQEEPANTDSSESADDVEDESDNQAEENNNEETDDSDQESPEQEAEVSDDNAEDANQNPEENEEPTESDTTEDGEVSSSLVDSATGVRVVSATDELEGKSIVVTVMNPSNAIGAAHDLYDIHILDENGSLYSLNNSVTVYLPANGYVSNVYYLGDIGETLEAVNYTTANGYAVFEVNSFSQYAVVYGNENDDNTTIAPVTGNQGTGGEDVAADQTNEHPTVYTEKDVNTESEAAADDSSNNVNQNGSGAAKETEEAEMLPDTGVAEQSTTIFAAILAALGLGFLVKRRKTTEK